MHLLETTKYLIIIIFTSSGIVFSINIIILMLWLIVLSRIISRLRKWNSVNNLGDKQASLDALNNKVEYNMSVFLFSIALLELISSAMAIGLNTAFITYVYNAFSNERNYSFYPALPNSNTSNNVTSNLYLSFSKNSLWNIFPQIWPIYFLEVPTLFTDSFCTCIVLTLCLVYTQMSYYAMVTRISLNHTSSLKSVNLANTQKILIYGSVCMVLVLSILAAIQNFMLKESITLLIITIQFGLTLRYRKGVLQALKWKLQDVKLAFGVEDYLYKIYARRFRYFKRVSSVYCGMIACFLLAVLLRVFRNFFELVFGHYVLVQLIYESPSQTEDYMNSFSLTICLMHTAEQLCLSIVLLLILTMNVATLPALLSKLNYSCYCRCKIFKNRESS